MEIETLDFTTNNSQRKIKEIWNIQYGLHTQANPVHWALFDRTGVLTDVLQRSCERQISVMCIPAEHRNVTN